MKEEFNNTLVTDRLDAYGFRLKLVVLVFLIGCVFMIPFSFSFYSNVPDTVLKLDSLQYPKGYPVPTFSAIQQLRQFPSPRYFKGNKLMRLFNWMDPLYMGGDGQPGIKKIDAVKNSIDLQEELALNWNYNIVIPNAFAAAIPENLNSASNPCLGYINLANKYPKIPLGVITFWLQVRPNNAGFPYNKPLIINQTFEDKYYLHLNWNGKEKTEINFNFPDSLIRMDGLTQKHYLQNILKNLKRPINMINENGEEPPGAYVLNALRENKIMQHLKDSLGISDWYQFMSIEKLEMRKKYSSCFMDEIPEIKNTLFSCYTVEAGPVDRFDWHIMKKYCSQINGKYYSTPDFYPRWPSNWRDWKGPWHGWKWIEEGREKEIKDGDDLFSPFISPGWSKNPEEDIRPSQWLGLLKCLSGAGAEFFYVGYFNMSAPFNDPRQYTWQAAMASYAQAITSRYEDELRNGHLLVNEKGKSLIQIKTNDPNILLVVRKHNFKDRYLICATLQPFSNNKAEVPDKKNITVEFDGQKLSFEARRQGSVYIYDKTNKTSPVFYQLDSWHENSHPDHWSKDICFEAEVEDTDQPLPVFTEVKNTVPNDFTNFTSYVELSKNNKTDYQFSCRKDTALQRYIAYRWRCKESGTLLLKLNENTTIEKKIKEGIHHDWQWSSIEIPAGEIKNGSNELLLECTKGMIDIDKIVVTEEKNFIKNKD